jgi:hypothetical protein
MTRKTTRRAGNPVEQAVRKAGLQRDIAELLTMADMHATWGNAPAQAIDRCGRVMFIVAYAAGRCRIPDDTPEVRILRGMANAVHELAQDHNSLDQHRATLSSGLQAAQRLMPRLNVWSIGEGAIVIDELLRRGHSVTTEHIDQLIQAPAALPTP